MSHRTAARGASKVRRSAFAPALRLALAVAAGCGAAQGAEPPLKISVFATAPDIREHLATPAARERTAAALRPFRITRIFLQGRLEDDSIPAAEMREIRDDLATRGFQTAGGLDFLPGKQFGARHNGKLNWMNYESAKTRADLAAFFREQAPVFEEIILDDSFCTEDSSPVSVKARGNRTWAQYRQDLLVRVLRDDMRATAQGARPGAGLIVKFPQWYDRFHLFGYDPPRMSALASRVWVGTETRDRTTRRLGFVEPTQGYIVFRWLESVAGEKVEGAWFDHLDCPAQCFVDQAYQSVLGGAREITFWHLGPLLEGHPGHARFQRALPELTELAARLRGRKPGGVAFYKPAGSASGDNMYLADYLAMAGLPVAPVAHYPDEFQTAFLGVQAAADPRLMEKMRHHLSRGATLMVTPALLRELGRAGAALAGVSVSAAPQPAQTAEVEWDRRAVNLEAPIDVDLGLEAGGSQTLAWVVAEEKRAPLVTLREAGQGRIMVWNLRTFSEQDFDAVQERLLPPRPLGLGEIPLELAGELRQWATGRSGPRVNAPAGVAYYRFGDDHVFYSFLSREVEIAVNGVSRTLAANSLLWW